MIKHLDGLNASEFEHPFDKGALDELKRTPGLDTSLKWLWKNGIEKSQNYIHLASNLQITEHNFPDIYSAFYEAKETLDMKEDIKLFLDGGMELNAWTTGGVNHLIILTRGLVDVCSIPQLQCVIGHEMGHIKAGHVLYQSATQLFSEMAISLSSTTFGLTGLASTGLRYALSRWYQMSEFSADRAGLLACQDFKVAQEVEMILAGFPTHKISDLQRSEWIKQTQEFQNLDYGIITKGLNLLFSGQLSRTHPFSVLRSAQIINWIETGGYGDVMSRKTKVDSSTSNISFCNSCGGTLYGVESFCPICGESLQVSSQVESLPVCDKCSFPIQSEAVFCNNCGNELSKN